MLFNSFSFLLFFICTTFIYYFINFKWRWFFLLVASCYFYAYLIPAYLLVLILIIVIDFLAGKLIESHVGRARKFYLMMSIVSNLSVLAIFKYHDFFIENLNRVFGLITPGSHGFSLWHLLLPVGLSFHTFQAMAYTIEVYKGKQRAEKNIGIYALYVLFYPQLVAGPIERPQNLIPQFYQKHNINYDQIVSGLKLMLWGLFLKVVVADRLGIYVNYVYEHVEVHSRFSLITAAIFYSYQIYCDFAGYSLIAIGSARVIGFSLSANFMQPYLASSPGNFWKRWNITLSQWFRDYVYFPMGGNRVTFLRYGFNILVVFILSGLWHGANWTFIVWGLLHGFLILAGYLKIKFVPGLRIPKWIGILSTFTLVSLGWIFFRSRNLHESFLYINRIFNPKTEQSIGGEFDERVLLIYSVFGIGCVMIRDIILEYYPGYGQWYPFANVWVNRAIYICLVVVIMLIGVFDGSQFIYFQF